MQLCSFYVASFININRRLFIYTYKLTFVFFQSHLISEVDRTGKSALHYCAENENIKCVEQILEAEPDLLHLQDEEGYTPLHLSVISGNKLVLKYLISKGADVNALDNENHSSIHWATGKAYI